MLTSGAQFLGGRNTTPTNHNFARNGDVVSGTVSEIRARDGMMLISLHDSSGRDVEVSREELKRHKHPKIGDRFRLLVDAKSGKLTAKAIAYLAPGETK